MLAGQGRASIQLYAFLNSIFSLSWAVKKNKEMNEVWKLFKMRLQVSIINAALQKHCLIKWIYSSALKVQSGPTHKKMLSIFRNQPRHVSIVQAAYLHTLQ